MKCNIFLPYYNYNDDKFDVKDYFSDSQSYIDALNKYATQDSNFMAFTKKEDEVQYAKCECTLFDEDNEEMTIDKFVGYFNRDNSIMLILELNLENEDEEFDVELNGWVNEHEKLDKFSSKIKEDERVLLEPKRDIKVVFNNLANKETYCTLVNSMLIDRIDKEHYVLIVDKVVFTKSF